MLKVNKYLAEQEYEVQIDGETHKYQIAPDFSGKNLRANIYFWDDLARNSIAGNACSLKVTKSLLIYWIQTNYDSN